MNHKYHVEIIWHWTNNRLLINLKYNSWRTQGTSSSTLESNFKTTAWILVVHCFIINFYKFNTQRRGSGLRSNESLMNVLFQIIVFNNEFSSIISISKCDIQTSHNKLIECLFSSNTISFLYLMKIQIGVTSY